MRLSNPNPTKRDASCRSSSHNCNEGLESATRERKVFKPPSPPNERNAVNRSGNRERH